MRPSRAFGSFSWLGHASLLKQKGGVFRGARHMRSLHLWISRLGALYENSTDVAKGKDVHTFTFEAYHVTSRRPFMLTMLKNLQMRNVASCWHFSQAKILRFQNLFESIQLQDSPGISHARLSAIGPGCSARGPSKHQSSEPLTLPAIQVSDSFSSC